MTLNWNRAATGWYVAFVVTAGTLFERIGMSRPSIADSARWLTLLMLVIGTALAVRDLFARRGTTHAFVLLLGTINYVGMGGLLVFQAMRRLGEPAAGYLGPTFTLVGIGLWCWVLVNSHRDEAGIDRQEAVDFWHPDQDAPKGG